MLEFFWLVGSWHLYKLWPPRWGSVGLTAALKSVSLILLLKKVCAARAAEMRKESYSHDGIMAASVGGFGGSDGI